VDVGLREEDEEEEEEEVRSALDVVAKSLAAADEALAE